MSVCYDMKNLFENPGSRIQIKIIPSSENQPVSWLNGKIDNENQYLFKMKTI